MTSEFHHVPVIEVHRENFQQIWPSLLLAIKSASFVGIDTELSGLGERKKLLARSIDDRYQSLCEVSSSRSIISLGLSVFKHVPQTDDQQLTTTTPLNRVFLAQTYNILLLCSEPYMVEPLSLQFLVQHGFDFNMQYAHGLPYHRGIDLPTTQSDKRTIRQLFSELIIARVPVIFHNGFVDLVFLYACLHCSLPVTLNTFVADLSSLFSAGVYDTKYISEFKVRLSSSYLEYVFRRSQMSNSCNSANSKSHVSVTFLNYSNVLKTCVVYLQCALRDKTQVDDSEQASTACQCYTAHGWCASGDKCDKSHDIDVIIQSEDSKVTQKRRQNRHKRKTTSDIANGATASTATSTVNSADTMDVCDTTDDIGDTSPVNTPTVTNKRCHGHRAGYDAFMTAFTFATYATNYGQYDMNASWTCVNGLDDLVNKVYLSAKDIPLQITQSNFARTSKPHDEKMQRLFP